MNFTSKAFDNYEVFWEEERGEVDLWQKLQTTFDFREANKAVQKALSQLKQAANETANNDADDWDDGAQSTTTANSKSQAS